MTRITFVSGDVDIITDPECLWSEVNLNKILNVRFGDKIIIYENMKFGDIDQNFINYVKPMIESDVFKIIVHKKEDDYCL